MYVGVDIGGTKTLVAVLDDDGVIQESRKFLTPRNYHEFLLELRHAVAFLTTKDFKAGGLGTAGNLDRERGVILFSINLGWKNVPVLADVEKILGCPVVMENDAKIAALSEAMIIKEKYARVMYVTISTGIGIGLVDNGIIDTSINDFGGAAILLEHEGKLVPWESYASGHAIVERYGKRAEDIHDAVTWRAIVQDLVPGFVELIAFTQPEVIVIGGSVGTYFDRYHKILVDELKKYKTPMLKQPVFRQASRPEEAVIFGCYDLAKQTFN
jgi:predicted NBD/HSP70 family sugar kinase